MRNAYHHGKRCSPSHATLLAEYERRNGYLPLNQGRRTIVEQARFYAAYLRYLAGGPWAPLAARPWGGAPHIKWGREHHALDINDGIVDRVAAFYRSLGIPVAFNVPGEPWHMDTLSEAALVQAAGSLRGQGGILATLKPGMRHADVKFAQLRLKKRGLWKRKLGRFYGPWMRHQIRAFQRKHGLTADGVIGPRTWAALKR